VYVIAYQPACDIKVCRMGLGRGMQGSFGVPVLHTMEHRGVIRPSGAVVLGEDFVPSGMKTEEVPMYINRNKALALWTELYLKTDVIITKQTLLKTENVIDLAMEDIFNSGEKWVFVGEDRKMAIELWCCIAMNDCMFGLNENDWIEMLETLSVRQNINLNLKLMNSACLVPSMRVMFLKACLLNTRNALASFVTPFTTSMRVPAFVDQIVKLRKGNIDNDEPYVQTKPDSYYRDIFPLGFVGAKEGNVQNSQDEAYGRHVKGAMVNSSMNIVWAPKDETENTKIDEDTFVSIMWTYVEVTVFYFCSSISAVFYSAGSHLFSTVSCLFLFVYICRDSSRR
jgi:hypothetical protein